MKGERLGKTVSAAISLKSKQNSNSSVKLQKTFKTQNKQTSARTLVTLLTLAACVQQSAALNVEDDFGKTYLEVN